MNAPKIKTRSRTIAIIGIIWGVLILAYMLLKGGPSGTGYYLLGEWHALAIGALMFASGVAAMMQPSILVGPRRNGSWWRWIAWGILLIAIALDLGFIAWMATTRAEIEARRVRFSKIKGLLQYSSESESQPYWQQKFVGTDLAGYAANASFRNSRTVTDADLPLLTELPRVQFVDLTGTGITDAGLATLADMPRLRRLRLDATGVTDAGLVHIRKMKNLELLAVNDTKITKSGLKQLSDFKHLKIEAGKM